MFEKFEKELDKSGNSKRQEFIILTGDEYKILVETYKKIGKPKGRTIGIACKLLLEKLKEDK